MKKKRNKNNTTIYIILIVAIISLLLVYGIYKLYINNRNVLLDKSREIVFSSYKNDDTSKDVPALNVIKLDSSVNEEINKFVEPYLDKDSAKIYYHYHVNGNILSLLITIEDYGIEGPPDVYFKSFNINLKTLEVYNNDDVLRMFDVDEDYIVEKITEIFNKYYEEEKDDYIINSKMTFEEYLKIRELTNIRDNLCYDIEDTKLMVYLKYKSWSSEEVSFYLKDVGYKFEIE